ncbi:uncharacterized protein AB675_1496 [Cyphellophora attinorum]|uniref:Uncharacterized protein n=1 Tax=Cyphellophora attinorum TaxID=1664694 RepID=A0A0N0NJR8_9EURO|nr:uncharacterized protein AB675_1496 [Phialophora attinorum]KPI37208.1 hypothetical protein AB675_1496 [Phialophora attinorum]
MRSAEGLRSAFLWVNNAGNEDEFASGTEKVVCLNTIRTHSKRVQRKRRDERLTSSALKIAQEGFQTPRQHTVPSSDIGNNTLPSTPGSELSSQQLTLRPRRTPNKTCGQGARLLTDPGRSTDAFRTLPMPLTEERHQIVTHLIDYVGDIASAQRAPGFSVLTDRWRRSISATLDLAFTSRVRYATLISGWAHDLSMRYEKITRQTVVSLMHQSLAITRESLRDRQHISPDHFFAAIMLFRAYRVLGDTEAAVLHLRAAHQFWRVLGGPGHVDDGTVGLFCSSVFGTLEIDYAALEPPMPPFYPQGAAPEPWPPNIVVNAKCAQPSVLYRADVDRLVDMIVDYAQRCSHASTNCSEARYDPEAELLNLSLRQHLLCLRTNDRRVRAFTIALQLLVFSLAGYSFFRLHAPYGAQYIKKALDMSAGTWHDDNLCHTVCLVIGAQFSSDRWFIHQLAILAEEMELLTRETIQTLLLRSCGALVADNLISQETIKSLSANVDTIIGKQHQQHSGVCAIIPRG